MAVTGNWYLADDGNCIDLSQSWYAYALELVPDELYRIAAFGTNGNQTYVLKGDYASKAACQTAMHTLLSATDPS